MDTQDLTTPEAKRAISVHPLAGMIVKRVVSGMLTVIAVSLVVFFAMELQPGEIGYSILGSEATPESVAAFRTKLGLDLPATVRYWEWISGFLTGNLGRSFVSEREIASLLGSRLANSFFLAGLAAAIAVPLSLALGMLAALYRKSWLDHITNVLALGSLSSPEFFLGYVLIFLFSIQLGWLPSFAQISAGLSFAERAHQSLLPAITLTLVITGHIMRMTRAAILNVMESPYVEMAVLKGISPARIMLRHALPNSIAPIFSVLLLNLAYLIVGVVVVEVVFAYPGLGQLLVDSVGKRDLPLVQAATLIFASTYVALNVLADVLSIVANPRLLYPK